MQSFSILITESLEKKKLNLKSVPFCILLFIALWRDGMCRFCIQPSSPRSAAWWILVQDLIKYLLWPSSWFHNFLLLFKYLFSNLHDLITTLLNTFTVFYVCMVRMFDLPLWFKLQTASNSDIHQFSNTFPHIESLVTPLFNCTWFHEVLASIKMCLTPRTPCCHSK